MRKLRRIKRALIYIAAGGVAIAHLLMQIMSEPSTGFLLVIWVGVTLALAVFIFGGPKRRIKVRSPRRKSFAATDKQMRFIAGLVEEQNFYRAKSLSLEEWLNQRKMKRGFISAKMASGLIESLLSENKELNEKFEQLKNQKDVGIFRGAIYVSDLRAFSFCERAAHFAIHQYPNQNLIDLERGQRIHLIHANSSKQNQKKPARVLEFIKKCEASVSRVEWLPNTADVSLRHPSIPISGRPDGYVHYRDGSKSIIELKSVSILPVTPRAADFDQADVYALLASTVTEVRNESLVLYTERASSARALHKRKRRLTVYDVAQMVAKLERGVRSTDHLSAARSSAQCTSCGYRSICSQKLAG